MLQYTTKESYTTSNLRYIIDNDELTDQNKYYIHVLPIT